MTVDASRPDPLWRQVVDALRDGIESGRWAENERIPSERELSDRLGVSRNTVRQAIAEAVRAGLLTRVQGRGTFVARRQVHQPLAWMQGFEETLRARGMVPGFRLVTVELRRLAASVAVRLVGDEAGEGVFVRMVGLGDGAPMAVYDSYVPLDLGAFLPGELGQAADKGRLELVNRLLAERNGWEYLQALQAYEAAGAGPEVAALLEVAAGAPVLKVTTLFQNPGGRPVEYREAFYRSDRYRFHITRRLVFGPAGALG